MKTAIIGSRTMNVIDLKTYIPEETTEIVSGGAKGIDSCAKEYALSCGLRLTEFRLQYNRYKKGAPLMRNLQIIDYADTVIAFWDGTSKGTTFVIDKCREKGKPVKVIMESDLL